MTGKAIRRLLVPAAAVSVVLASAACTARFQNNAAPSCTKMDTLVLMAQSVPTATLVPCIKALPAGWAFGGMNIRSGRSTFNLDSDRAGAAAVRVTMTEACREARGTAVKVSDEAGTTQYERIDSLIERYNGTRSYTFPGGCVTYRFDFEQGTALVNDVNLALAFTTREVLNEEVKRSSGGVLHL